VAPLCAALLAALVAGALLWRKWRRAQAEEPLMIQLTERRVPLAEGLAALVASAPSAALAPERFVGKISTLVTGNPAEAARGISYYMGVADAELYRKMAQGVAAIEREWALAVDDARAALRSAECEVEALTQRGQTAATREMLAEIDSLRLVPSLLAAQPTPVPPVHSRASPSPRHTCHFTRVRASRSPKSPPLTTAASGTPSPISRRVPSAWTTA